MSDQGIAPPLRPMTLGEILDRTFQIYRGRFGVFFAIAAIPGIAMSLLQFMNFFWWKLHSPPGLLRLFGISVGTEAFALGQYHCSFFFHVLVWPWMVFAASEEYLGGHAGIISSVRAILRRRGSWCGLSLLLPLFVLVIPEASVAAIWLGIGALGEFANFADEPIMTPLMTWSANALALVGYAASLWAGAAYLGAIPVWGLEKLKLRTSFKRGRRLSMGCRLQITFTRAVPALIGFVLGIALNVVTRAVMLFVARTMHFRWFYVVALSNSAFLVVTAAIAALVGPIFPIALTLFYYDQRIRKEGFDIEWMMRGVGMGVPAPAVAETAAEGAEADVAPRQPAEPA